MKGWTTFAVRALLLSVTLSAFIFLYCFDSSIYFHSKIVNLVKFTNQTTRPPTLNSTVSTKQAYQDDPELINQIRQYIIPPAPPLLKLNLSRKIWSSPVVKRVKQILGSKTGGVFIEAGALDGEFLSNSLELETYYGWTGLLVEADPQVQKQLVSKNRKAWIAATCLSPDNYTINVTFDKHEKWTGLSNIGRLQKPLRKKNDFKLHFNSTCFPLFSLVLATLNQTEIDYLSLDVEGAEWQVLQTIPFHRLRIKVISLEMTRVTILHKNDIHKLLESHGFVFQGKITAPYVDDEIFVHSSVTDKTSSKTISHLSSGN